MLPSYEKIIASERSSFAYRWFRVPGFPFRWHVHPEVELTYIVAGRGQRFVGDDIADFTPDELVLMAGGLPHTWHSRPHRRKSSESVVIQFLPDCLGRPFYDAPEMADVRALVDRAAVGLLFPRPLATRVGERMLAMHEMDPLQRLMELLSILSDLSRARDARPLSSPGFAQALRASDRQRIDRVFRMIDAHRGEPISQAQVAEAVGLTPAGFSRFFRRTTGRTFVEYVHELRIGRACRLLIETDEPVTAIAFDCGFGNLSHFNRLFRRRKGLTPREFRQAYRVHEA